MHSRAMAVQAATIAGMRDSIESWNGGSVQHEAKGWGRVMNCNQAAGQLAPSDHTVEEEAWLFMPLRRLLPRCAPTRLANRCQVERRVFASAQSPPPLGRGNKSIPQESEME